MFDDLSILILDIERATLVNIHERGSFCIDRLFTYFFAFPLPCFFSKAIMCASWSV